MACSGQRRLFNLSVAVLFALIAAAPAVADKAKQLAELREKIAELKKSLESDRGEHSALLRRLADSERNMGRLNIQLDETRQRQQELEEELVSLARQRHGHQQSLRADKLALSDQLLASYVMSSQGHLKLLLADRSPAEIGRTLAYYDYLNRARSQRIVRLDRRLQNLHEIEKRLDARNDELAESVAAQQRSQQQLGKEQAQRKQVVAKLAQQITGKESQLLRLSEDEKALQRLLSEIERNLIDIPSEIDGGEPFAKRKGRLEWPVAGSLKTRFGSQRGIGKQKWQGIEIVAVAGEQVRAVSAGRVAFADWLRGFGLLIIVDHGEGYMTLYGRNQSLYQEVGDWVTAGDIIASVGNSGGGEQSALYFEVRHKGQPQNPLNWIVSRR